VQLEDPDGVTPLGDRDQDLAARRRTRDVELLGPQDPLVDAALELERLDALVPAVAHLVRVRDVDEADQPSPEKLAMRSATLVASTMRASSRPSTSTASSGGAASTAANSRRRSRR
jgi:hypothetical protein